MAQGQQRTGAGIPASPRGTDRRDALLDLIVGHGDLTSAEAENVQRVARRRGLRIAETLASVAGLSQARIARAQAMFYQAQQVDPVRHPPDARLLALTDPKEALDGQFLPWRMVGGATVIATSAPELVDGLHRSLVDRYGPIRLAITTPDQLTAAISEGFGATLLNQAERRIPRLESCRDWDPHRARRPLALVLCGMALVALSNPTLAFTLLCGLCLVTLFAQGVLKGAALFATLRYPVIPPDADILPARLPQITMLIPLFDEHTIAAHLLDRLRALDYPPELLDLCFVMEAGDAATARALARSHLEPWMRHVIVPPGRLQTKPRALNYALSFARGEIVGVWDAEDAPAPDQLQLVARRFAAADDRLACLQGVLDYYNPAATWLTRCFAIEYAGWFRVVLPGLARLGLVVPLGGTTLFFRRHLLEKLGAWDAHNVTEDADLGVRLARHGYRTEFLDTVTEEEANGRTWPWIKQRARWLKGYALTYGVAMRRPVRLWRELGTWRVFGLQVLFLGTLLQFLLAPVLWSFWIVPFGGAHPFVDAVPRALFLATAIMFLLTEALNLAVAVIGVRRAGKGWLIPWVPTLHLYFPLAAVAAWKGVAELLRRPFFWDKTAHGVDLPPRAATPPPRPPLRPVGDG